MKFWNSDTDFTDSDVPERIAAIAYELGETLRGDGPCPRLLRIGQADDREYTSRYLVEVELAPGLVLPTEYGSDEGLLDGSESEDDDVEEIVDLVRHAIGETLPRTGELSALVHDARIQARRVIGGWNASGLPTRLMGVALAPLDHWEDRLVPTLHIVVEELDGALLPDELTITVAAPDRIAEALAEWHGRIARGYDQRTRLARLDASGTVSRLALNALERFGPVDEALRRFAREWRFWLPDDTAIVMMNGHVGMGTGDPHSRRQWMDGRLEVSGLHIRADELRAAIGKPLSSLIHDAVLTDDVTVTGARSWFEDGVPRVAIEFDNPKLLFCSTTGRIWRDGDTTVGGTPTAHAADAGNVVPLPQRARR